MINNFLILIYFQLSKRMKEYIKQYPLHLLICYIVRKIKTKF